MSLLKELSDQQLSAFDSIIREYREEGIDALDKAVKNELTERRIKASKGMNTWLDISQMIAYDLFDLFELYVMTENNIRNMKDLVEADLDRLKVNGELIPEHVKESLAWKRQVYDFSCYDEKGKQFVKSGKKEA